MVQIPNYTDLGITSTKKPFNTHLWWEHTTYGIMMVDSTNQAVLLFSTKARLLIDGSDWDVVDLSDNVNSYKIQSGWLDGVDLWLVMCDNDGTADDFEVCFIELDDSNDCNPVDVSSGGDVNTVYAYDIFKFDGDIYVVSKEERGGTVKFVGWDVDTDPFVEITTQSWGGALADLGPLTYGVIVDIGGGEGCYFFFDVEASNNLYLLSFNGTIFTASTEHPITDVSFPSDPNQLSLAWDGVEFVYNIYEKDGDGLTYLNAWSYFDDANTNLGRYDVALQLDRNTASGVQEKAFHITEDRIYQLSSTAAHQLYLISAHDFVDTIIAITDNFLMCAGGEMYEYINLADFVYEMEIMYGSMRIPGAIMICSEQINISTGMLIKVIDTFTTGGSSTTEIIFEGYVEPFIEQKLQEVLLRSPAQELKRIKPEGDYIGRSDQIISQLILEYCGYVTEGTLSAGIELGQIHFNGDKSLFQILNEFALTDRFIWSLSPAGILDYNDGTVDSTIDINETDNMTLISRRKGERAINKVKIKGSIVDGDQAMGDGVDNIPNQNLNGINPIERTISHLNTNALCITTETNILSRWGTQSTLIEFTHYDPTIGVIQVSQTITFRNNKIDPNISQAQYFIENIIYDALNQHPTYIISDDIT